MNPLSETQARRALAGLGSETVDETGVEVAFGRLLGDLPRATGQRRRALIPALGVGVAVVLVLGVVIGIRSGGAGGHRDVRPSPTLTLPSTANSLADGLTIVTSLIDVGGYLWASGNDHQGGDAQLVRVQIATRKASNSVLMTTDGSTVGVSHLATAAGRVYGVTADGGVESFAPNGSRNTPLTAAQLGSSAESLAASPSTGLYLLSCCGSAPAEQQLVTRRDPVTLAALGDRREITAIPGSLLAAGPAGVWALDADSGAIRRISGDDTPGRDPVIDDSSHVPHDLLAVGTAGPVVAKADQLIAVDGRTLAVRRAALPLGLPTPTALSVVGTTAYLAFTGQILRYDLTTMTETGSFAVTGVTAMTAGPDGVWAATHRRLVRVDTLPVLPAAPPTYRTIPTGFTGIGGLVDVDGQLWASTVPDPAANGGTLSRVEIADGSVHREKAAPGVLSTDGTRVFEDNGYPGVVTSFTSGGTMLRSKTLQAIDIAASKARVAVLSCCDTATPNQHIRFFDPATLAQIGKQVNIAAQGENGQLIAGDAGTWFLTEDSSMIYRVDTTPIRAVTVERGGQENASLTAMSSRGPVVATADGDLVVVDGSTVNRIALPESESAPTALTVSGETIYVAFADKIISYGLSHLDEELSLPISGVTAMTAGPDGVWAATAGTLVQVARP